MLPAALRRAGLLEALSARDGGSVAPRAAYDPVRDAATGLLNGPGLREAIGELARAVAAVLERGETPIVLAGDCSVVLAGLTAMQSRGETALLFIDGHADFDEPSQSPTGEVADMDLALATGQGLVREEHVAAIGTRDGDGNIRRTRIHLFELAAIRARGIAAIAGDALRAVPRRFWCHVDADVLDDAVMPFVDYRQPGGLAPAELEELLRRAHGSGRMAGLSIAIYNPALDADGEGARLLAGILARSLIPSRPATDASE
jgi:arginase